MSSANPSMLLRKLRGLCSILALTFLAHAGLLQAQAPTQPTKIEVRILSASNGHAIRSRQLAFVLGVDTDRPIGITDAHGTIVVKVDPSTTIRLITQPGADCRPATPNPSQTKYSIAEILAHGISTENTCGKARVEARPGQLLLFEPPRGKLGFLFGGFSY